RSERERPLGRVAHVAVAMERETTVERLGGCVLLGLEAREHHPGEREDPEQGDEPGGRPEGDRTGAALADPELRAATRAIGHAPSASFRRPDGTRDVGHARSSSFRRPDSTRNANVAITIAKTTTTMA